MFKWYKTINKILVDQPEVWLSYFYGQQLDKLTHLNTQKKYLVGVTPQLLKYSYSLLKAVTISPKNSMKNDKKCEYYVYAGTNNQLCSIESTIRALRKRKQHVIATVPKSLITSKHRKQQYQPLQLEFTDVFKSILLLITRSPKLYKELISSNPWAVKNYFSEFCSNYTYLVYFERVLNSNGAKFVITSNDHSTSNRCLLAVAHELGIKTVYLQHASVSNLFPALEVDYAFLDGQSALETYKRCKNNQPDTMRNKLMPKIFLSGQKKPLDKKNKFYSTSEHIVGIAINSLDDIDIIINLAETLSKFCKNIIIRWHPNQNKNDVNQLKSHFRLNKKILLSNPNQEPVGGFLSCINWLVAGNSSIHLEAALIGVSPIYYESKISQTPDYYGYVNVGLAIKANDFEDIKSIILQNGVNIDVLCSAIQYYSSTYGTQWEGKEGELVAECLIGLKNKAITPIEPITLR